VQEKREKRSCVDVDVAFTSDFMGAKNSHIKRLESVAGGGGEGRRGGGVNIGVGTSSTKLSRRGGMEYDDGGGQV
jgi:hypothetical protein